MSIKSNFIPQISIITPSFNQGQFIEENILSVLHQNYPNFQHIIIDGGSIDNTLEILSKYPHLVWVSEEDRGQADALNKGFEKATGEIIGWQNADDCYLNNAFHEIAEIFMDNKHVRWIVGDVLYLYDHGRIQKIVKSPKVNLKALIKNPDIVKQHSSFFYKTLVQQAGGFNSTFHMVMDFDLWVRMAKIEQPLMVNKTWASYRHHDDQKTQNVRNTKTQIREIGKIYKREKISVSIRLIFLIRKQFKIMVSKVLLSLKMILIKMKILDKRYVNKSFYNRK